MLSAYLEAVLCRITAPHLEVGLATVTVPYGPDGSVVRSPSRAATPPIDHQDGRIIQRAYPSNTVHCTAVTALDGTGRVCAMRR